MGNKNKGENNVEKLEKHLSALIDLKKQVETRGVTNEIKIQLKLMLRVVWGSDGYYTKKYCKSIDEIKSGRTLGYTVARLSGKITSSYPKTPNTPYSSLLNEIEKSLRNKISKIQSTENIIK